MVRFSGIYGLYVNKSVEKTNKGRFGYWRPGVRISTLRPKKEKRALAVLFSFFAGVGDENYILAQQEGVRFSNEAVEKLAFQWQVQKFCPKGQYLHTSTKKR